MTAGDHKDGRAGRGFYFPPPGPGLSNQAHRHPRAVGLDPAIVDRLQAFMIEGALAGPSPLF